MLNLVNPVKADLRQEITAWKALVWAYRDEMVHMATNNDTGRMEPGLAQNDYQEMPTGSTAGILLAHDDALLIDRKARKWFEPGKMYHYSFSRACARRHILPRARDLKPLRFVPVYRANGTIKMEYRTMGRKGEPYYCPVETEGHTREELDEAQRLHDLFIAFLDVMPGFSLAKWRIIGRGLTNGGESLTKR